MNVLITCHSHEQNIAEQLRNKLTKQHFTCYIVTETTPESISARANLIRWCDVFIVIISRMYHRTCFCMETINFAKDARRPIIAILAESNFQPYGALGAISASAVKSIALGNDGVSENLIAQLSTFIPTQNNKKRDTKNITDPAKVCYYRNLLQTIVLYLQFDKDNKNVHLVHGDNSCTVLICTTDDGASVGQLIYDEFTANNINVGFENLSKPNAVCSVRRCTVFVPILSPQLALTPACQAVFEEARRLQKPIVPVIATKNWKPDNWVGLTIAGSTFFRMFDKENAYKPFHDSNRMTDLRVEVEVSHERKFLIRKRFYK